MAQFSVNANRFDPYKNFKFRVYAGGKLVAGVSKVTALKRTTEVVKHRAGGDPSTSYKSPGTTDFEAVTLDRGLTHDRDFETWANKVYSTDGDGAVSLRDLRKDLRFELLNLQGTVVAAYNVYRCWVTSYTALPDLDANGQGVAFESIVLAIEGWERDESVVEVAET